MLSFSQEPMIADLGDKRHPGSPIGRLASRHAFQGIVVGSTLQRIACQPFIVGSMDVFHDIQKRVDVSNPHRRVLQPLVETRELLAGLHDIRYRPALPGGTVDDDFDHGPLAGIAFTPGLVIDGQGQPKQCLDHSAS